MVTTQIKKMDVFHRELLQELPGQEDVGEEVT